VHQLSCASDDVENERPGSSLLQVSLRAFASSSPNVRLQTRDGHDHETRCP